MNETDRDLETTLERTLKASLGPAPDAGSSKAFAAALRERLTDGPTGRQSPGQSPVGRGRSARVWARLALGAYGLLATGATVRILSTVDWPGLSIAGPAGGIGLLLVAALPLLWLPRASPLVPPGAD